MTIIESIGRRWELQQTTRNSLKCYGEALSAEKKATQSHLKHFDFQLKRSVHCSRIHAIIRVIIETRKNNYGLSVGEWRECNSSV